jgi:RimJ/RimL family protein N-acetyltransferase
MNNYKTFETDRLLLKPTSTDDAEFLFELYNTPKWFEYIEDRNIRTVEDAREYIESKTLPQLHKLWYSNYTLIRKSDHKKIGTCGLFDRDGLEGIDIGFALLPEFEGKGYAIESAKKITDLAFNIFGLTELSAITVTQNISSQSLCERLGMVQVGTIKLPGDEEELLLYRIKKYKTD